MNHKIKLIKYIRKSRKLGLSIKEITDSLLAGGWSREEIKDAFKVTGRNYFLSFFLILFEFIFDIFLRLKKVFKGDIFTLKEGKHKLKKKFIKKEDRLKKESSILLSKKRYDFSDLLSKFSGKISFFDAFYLAKRIFKIERKRVFLLIFALSFAFSLFLYLGYFFLNFNGYLQESTYMLVEGWDGLQEGVLFDTFKQIRGYFYFLFLFAVLVFSFSVLGIINTIKDMALERKKEIEIMKIAGASKKDVFCISFAKSIIMGIFGGVTGFLASYFALFFINYTVIFAARVYLGVSLDVFWHPLYLMGLIFLFFLLFWVPLSDFGRKIKFWSIKNN